MELGSTCRQSKFSSFERLAATALTVLAVASPLYMGRRSEIELQGEEPINFASWLPLLLLLLVSAIAISGLLDRSLYRCDPYWIHRVGGSSVGIAVILMVLLLVLKCKATATIWEA